MKKVWVLALTAVLVLAASAIALPQDASKSQDNPSASSSKSLRGTVSSVDNSAKSFVVKDASGTETTVFWNDSTRLSGELAPGATVRRGAVIHTDVTAEQFAAPALRRRGGRPRESREKQGAGSA